MTVARPIPDFAAARAAMVESQLRPQGVTDPACSRRWRPSPREHSCPSHSRPLAYADRAVAIGSGRFLPAPAVLGQFLTAMMPERGQRALVVGAGHWLFRRGAQGDGPRGRRRSRARRACRKRARARHRGRRGAARRWAQKGAPYDLILIDGAVEVIPDAIIGQLADGGRLGTALVDRGVTRLVVGRKAGEAFGYLSPRRCGGSGAAGLHPAASFTF